MPPALVAPPPDLWRGPTTPVTLARHAFRTDTLHLEAPAGLTVDEIIAAAGLPEWAICRVWIDDWEIAPQYWGVTRPRPGRKVLIRVVPRGSGGNNKTLRLVLMIVLVIVVTVVTWGVGTIPAVAALGATGTLIAGLAGAAVMIAGTLAINALLPPPKPKFDDMSSTSPASATYALTGTQNQIAPYQPIPRVYGRHRIFPPLAAYPTTWSEGTGMALNELFTCGYGPVQIEDIRIGDTPIGSFPGAQVEVRNGWPSDAPLSNPAYSLAQWEESISIDMTPPDPTHQFSAQRTSRDNIDWMGLDIAFPRGLFVYDQTGALITITVALWIFQRPAGSNEAWQTVTYWPFWDEARQESLRYSIAWGTPYRGQWEIQLIYELGAGYQHSELPEGFIPFFDCVWVALRSARYVNPIQMPGMGVIGIKLQASGQLNGVVQQLNCIATSVLAHYTRATGEWHMDPSRNPAWIFYDILTGTANPRPVPFQFLDFDAILRWAEDCDARGYTFDGVFDAQTTVFEALQQVAAVGRASLTLRDGKYSVIRDIPQQTPVQLFTPRNSSGFRGTRVFTEMPHALKVRWINPDANWQQDERYVYDDGRDQWNSTRFETLDMFGVTDSELAWRHGRYWFAAAKLRPETYTLGVDIEHLVANRGDLVHVQHDVPLWGIASGRIVFVAHDGGGNVIGFTLDEYLEEQPDGTHLMVRIRDYVGQSWERHVSVFPRLAQRDTYVALGAAESPVTLPINPGDLVAIGQVNSAVVPCIISRIEAAADLSARLTLVDAAPEIQNADQGPIPPFDAHVTQRPTAQRLPPRPPVIASVTSDESAMLQLSSGTWVVAIRVGANVQPDASRVPPTLIQAEYRPIDSALGWIGVPVQSADAGTVTFYFQPVTVGREYEIRLRAVNAPTSLASQWVVVRHVVGGATYPPPAPQDLILDVQGLHLRWQYSAPPADFLGFLVRYSQSTDATWEQAQPLHGGIVSDTRFALPPLAPGTYTFLVKAIDQSGTESVSAASTVATISPTGNTAVMSAVDWGPTPNWPGTKVNLAAATSPSPRLCTQVAGDPLFWDASGAPLWVASDAALFWGNKFADGSYTIAFTPAANTVGSIMTLDWSGTAGWILEYRVSGGAWIGWPGALTAQNAPYEIRWRSAGTAQVCLFTCRVLFNVTPVSEIINGVAIAAGGTRLPLAKHYLGITNVQVTPVQVSGQPVKIAEVVDKDATGPLVRLRQPDGTSVAGTVDAVVQGF